MSLNTRIYIGVVIAAGFVLLAAALPGWNSQDPARFLCYLAVAACVSGFKVSLPGVTGTMSVNFLFVLFGIAEMTLPETLVIGCGITALQCLWNAKRQARFVQVLFNVASMAIAITLSARLYQWSLASWRGSDPALLLATAALVFFLLNTVPVAAAIALTERKSLPGVWRDCYFWSFPYYLAGAAIATAMSATQRFIGWETALLAIPLVYLIYSSYRLYLDRLENQRSHAQQVAALHLRTIETLALAIDAKDNTTGDHLRRVETYAVAVGRELGMAAVDIEALRAAAVLRDIGKLGVPDNITSKPGCLSPAEFDKMKIHPLVGAEILEHVQFPYPVVPIVRSHHEKWDGSGYPLGLKGEEIPLGARILAAVDCLDAIASDRQYRRSLPLDKAMLVVAAESGKSFDPKVIEVLRRRYRDFERTVLELAQAPAAVKALALPLALGSPAETPADFLHSIAAARQEVQTLFELAQDLGNSLSLDDTLSLLAVRLRRMIPWDAMAVYVRRGSVLIPEFVTGDDFRLFSSLEIPTGLGLSGWVVENHTPILNGDPAAESEYLHDASRVSKLASALAVPLNGVNGCHGVLTLYGADSRAFSKDHLRILLAISSKVALSIENALRFRQAESSATTDFLTGLPNARSLFLQLDAELARCRRTKADVTVLVCDLDGFKQINDRFGHLEGNKVLHAVATGLKDACREYDYVARMGGDEFVILLPGLAPEALSTKLDIFRNVVREAGESVCGAGFLGLSIGQAFSFKDGTDAEGLLAEADRSMYQDKQQSRQRAEASQRLWSSGLESTTVQ